MNGQAIDGTFGTIFDLQHFCLDDGPGIRSTVFLKGCPLRCIWCHNPESYEMRENISYHAARCVGCGACAKVCPAGAHVVRNGIHEIDRTLCTRCGVCATVCCYTALEKIGKTVSADAVIKEVRKDKNYYQKAGPGGMTVSGGEPFQQAFFLQALLEKAKGEGIHTCIETSGYTESDALERMIPLTDLFLFDLKGARESYPKLTGVSADAVYNSLKLLLRRKCRIVIRIPLVAGVNDTDRFFDELGELYCQEKGIEAFEIMPYHSMGASKAEQLSISQGLKKQKDATEEQKKEWLDRLRTRRLPAAVNYFNDK